MLAPAPARSRVPVLARPVVIEARGINKTFRIPDQRIDSFRERVTHPLRRPSYRLLHALRDISFEVHAGEFFGIVGRNGSGKSTLLKIMASIYRADSGRIRMAGQLAPFIELGVGFNPELTSRQNVLLNGVLMGLTRQEARGMLGAVLEFAELEEFADLKLKNYSSGMMVRLAFAVMVQANTDIMLIDEVLAVGDAAFAQKCTDVFRARRDAGRTVVLVTHDMPTVQSFCDRAMLIHDGEMRYIGDPEETALRYYRLNFGGSSDDRAAGDIPDVNVSVLDAWLENRSGQRVDNVEQDEPIGFNALVQARHDLADPIFGFHCLTAEGVQVFGFNLRLDLAEGEPDVLRAGQRVRISGTIENRLLPGRYYMTAMISRSRHKGDLAVHALRLLEFVVYGTQPGPGSVSVQSDLTVTIEADDG